jgi:class 3 adenylate cyclase
MSAEGEPTPHESWLELPDGTVHWLAERCAIGREGGNDLVLGESSVSRRHALIESAPDGARVLNDLRSSNGTYLNGVPLARPKRLQDGDELNFGRVTARYRCNRPAGTRVLDPTWAATVPVECSTERPCWLLLADLASYSSLIAQHGNRGALERFHGWVAGLRPLLEGNGGVINSYVGDAILAWWPDETETAGRLATALAAIGAWRSVSPAVFRLALHRGTAVFTRSDRGEELAGRDVNFVFRSDKVAKKLGTDTVLTEAAARAMGPTAGCLPLGEAEVEGIPGRSLFFSAPRRER